MQRSVNGNVYLEHRSKGMVLRGWESWWLLSQCFRGALAQGGRNPERVACTHRPLHVRLPTRLQSVSPVPLQKGQSHSYQKFLHGQLRWWKIIPCRGEDMKQQCVRPRLQSASAQWSSWNLEGGQSFHVGICERHHVACTVADPQLILDEGKG